MYSEDAEAGHLRKAGSGVGGDVATRDILDRLVSRGVGDKRGAGNESL